MVKSVSKIAAKLGDVKIIVKIDSDKEINEMSKARLNTVAAIVTKTFTPIQLKKSESEIKVYDFEK